MKTNHSEAKTPFIYVKKGDDRVFIVRRKLLVILKRTGLYAGLHCRKICALLMITISSYTVHNIQLHALKNRKNIPKNIDLCDFG